MFTLRGYYNLQHNKEMCLPLPDRLNYELSDTNIVYSTFPFD